MTTKKTTKQPRKRGWNYPRAGYGKIHRWLPSWRFMLGSLFASIALGIGAFFGLYAAIDVPEPDDFALAQATNVYYGDATQKLGKFAEADRKSVELSEISPHVQHAVISSEDRGFTTTTESIQKASSVHCGTTSKATQPKVDPRSPNSMQNATTPGKTHRSLGRYAKPSWPSKLIANSLRITSSTATSTRSTSGVEPTASNPLHKNTTESAPKI